MTLRIAFTGAEKLLRTVPDRGRVESAVIRRARKFAGGRGRAILEAHSPVDTGLLKRSWRRDLAGDLGIVQAATARRFVILIENRTEYARYALLGRGAGSRLAGQRRGGSPATRPSRRGRSRRSKGRRYNREKFKRGLRLFEDALQHEIADEAQEAARRDVARGTR